MESPVYTWHEAKAISNAQKHGVTFAEAQTVFDDPLAAIFPDDDHADEAREIIIGWSAQQLLLVVSFIAHSETVRIISARRATPHERADYEEGH
jgi:uncharacterized protein